MTTQKNIVFSIATTIFSGLIIIWAANVQAASGCVTSTWTNIAGNGAQANLSVTNSSACGAKQVSLCSYRVYIRPNTAGWLSTQTLFDSQVITLQPGQTVVMAVNTDKCMNQVDSYEGPCVNPFVSDNTSIPSIFAGRMTEYTDTLCIKCTNECSTEGLRECNGNGFKQCNKGADGCFHWNNNNCDANQICSGGSCIASCSDECSTVGQRECDGSGYKECGNFDADSCKEWKHFDCQTNETCSNGSCNKKIPTVDLNASGTAACNRTATLTWISTNADSCSAAGAWSGTKATSGTENTGNFTGSKTYTLTCSNAGGSASDSVTINGQGDTLNASAGADMDVDAGESIQLNGSVSGDGFGGQANISWSCTGGTLSNRNALRPTFTTDDGDGDETYTCTMTATNECGTDSDTMKVTVNKRTSNFKVNLTAQSDCAPLNDVDLVAKLSNYSGNDYDYTYYFDCDNDGDWEKTVTTSKTSYTAENLCNYRKVGEYTAKVKVTSHDRTVTDTARVNAENCEKQIEQKGNVSITKTVMNVSKGSIYSGSVTADPGDAVSYRIVVTGSNGAVNNVTLRDSMPSGVANIRDLRVDGAAGYGNIESGIDLGTLSSGQSKIVTFTATVAGESYFAYGQTTLTNIATVTADGLSASSNAAVYVYRRAVQGATIVSTGFDGNIFAGIGAAIAGAILSLGWSLSHFLKGKKMTAEELLSQKINSIKQNSLA